MKLSPHLRCLNIREIRSSWPLSMDRFWINFALDILVTKPCLHKFRSIGAAPQRVRNSITAKVCLRTAIGISVYDASAHPFISATISLASSVSGIEDDSYCESFIHKTFDDGASKSPPLFALPSKGFGNKPRPKSQHHHKKNSQALRYRPNKHRARRTDSCR